MANLENLIEVINAIGQDIRGIAQLQSELNASLQGKSNKSGDTMTGNLVIKTNGGSYVQGKHNNTNSWFVGRASASNNDVHLHSYTYNYGFALKSDRAELSGNKPLYVAGNPVYHAGNHGFTQNLAEKGWTKLPNGLILQWGVLSPPSSSGRSWQDALAGAIVGGARGLNPSRRDAKFPIAFPSKCVAVSLCAIDASKGSKIYSYSSSSFNVEVQDGKAIFIAIGF